MVIDEQVCNKTDCPKYKHYTDIDLDTRTIDVNKEITRLKDLLDSSSSSSNNAAVRSKLNMSLIHKLAIRSQVQALCSRCKYFNKIDVYEQLIRGEALELLTEED